MSSPTPAVTSTPLSNARACIGDVALLGREIPLFPVERTMQLGGLAAARGRAVPRIGWAAVFLKAYAVVAENMPALRTWIVRGAPHGFRLRDRLATSAESVATLAVNRVEEGEDRLFWPRLRHPDRLGLREIQGFVEAAATQPVKDFYKRQLQLEMLPGALRRTILRWNMNSCSPKRAARIGTFSLSTLAGAAATNRFHPTICTTSLSYAPLEADGRCLVTLIADHRVIDGAQAARALERLEQVLAGRMAEELAGLAAVTPAPTLAPAAGRPAAA